MFRLWQLYDPRGVLVAIGALLLLLALLIHLLLLGSTGFNWLAQSDSHSSAGLETVALASNIHMHRGFQHVC